MVRFVLLAMCVFAIASCTRSDREPTYVRPKSEKVFGLVPYDNFTPKAYQSQPQKNTPADPNSSYAQGYQAGCQTMSSAIGEGLFRLRGPKLDPELLTTDAWYLRGYNDAAAACTFVYDWELH